ncbi:hypothetical protein [Halonotius roseus]|uniref:Calcineurin-like phosphoesterase domain-containing protein n=1 Tax=Halonotius roseus TaxID=2511997 RepID=A0A544QR23_9EURY|nr:hypothetical protein [Halonotius roseus]TQQ81894.1 hypothetical protein EWF95_02850 [Halonotius roseus]
MYDLFRRAEQRDPSYSFSSEDGEWQYERVAADGGVVAAEPTTHRVPTAQKQSVTKAANDFLADLELDLRERLADYEPVTAERPTRTGAVDLVMFRTDDHIGSTETVADKNGTKVEIHNSEKAINRVYQHLQDVLLWKIELEELGRTVDTVHLLMNGDHITGEDIYEGQGFEVDSTLREQVRDGSTTYVDVIRILSAEFNSVQVVCQHGNHGELRTGSQSSEANADDLMFDAIDLALRQSDLDNINLITNHIDTHIEFDMRGHRGYMRHGQDTLGHIGTTSGEQRWQAWLLQSIDEHDGDGWDVGYVGHYHELKVEPVNGRPVLMGGTPQPASDYENSLGIPPGRPGAWTHTVTDTEPIGDLRPTYFT